MTEKKLAGQKRKATQRWPGFNNPGPVGYEETPTPSAGGGTSSGSTDGSTSGGDGGRPSGRQPSIAGNLASVRYNWDDTDDQQQSRPGSGGQYNSPTTTGSSRASAFRQQWREDAAAMRARAYQQDAAQQQRDWEAEQQAAQPVKTGQTTTTSRTFTGPAPELGERPEYEAPEEWDPERRAAEIQKSAALGLRESRRGLSEVTSGLGNDPVSAYALREALGQHGINIERTLTGARAEAYEKEQADLARQTHIADVEYQGAMSSRALEFEAAYNKWLSSARDVSTTKAQFAPAGSLTDTTSGKGFGSSSIAKQEGTGGTVDFFRNQILQEFG